MVKGVDTKDHLNSNDDFEECNTFNGSDKTYKITSLHEVLSTYSIRH